MAQLTYLVTIYSFQPMIELPLKMDPIAASFCVPQFQRAYSGSCIKWLSLRPHLALALPHFSVPIITFPLRPLHLDLQVSNLSTTCWSVARPHNLFESFLPVCLLQS